MNYLAHGFRYLGQPHFLAGTAVPDWLSVLNRRVRARARLVAPVVESTESDVVREIGRGILQHHRDDDAFHRCEMFMRLEARLGGAFREHMPDPFDHRPGFLGHIVVELMLDAWLMAGHSTLLEQYYDALNLVSAEDVEEAVCLMTTRPPDGLARLVERFRSEQFLHDYRDDSKLLFRINQVLRRVRLAPVPDETVAVLAFARTLLEENGADLLAAAEVNRN